MKLWSLLVLIVYGLLLVALSGPILVAGTGDLLDVEPDFDWDSARELYTSWFFYLWVGLLVLAQAVLLLTRIDPARERPRARRSLAVSRMVVVLFLGLLSVLGLFCVTFMFFGDDVFDWFLEFPFFLELPMVVRDEVGRIVSGNEGWAFLLRFGCVLLLFWVGWWIVFARLTRRDTPANAWKRQLQWLLRGSVLELLVALPSHVVVRHRDDCCAPAGTMIGIAAGISVMLLAFGPAVLWLYVDRIRKLKPCPRL